MIPQIHISEWMQDMEDNMRFALGMTALEEWSYYWRTVGQNGGLAKGLDILPQVELFMQVSKETLITVQTTNLSEEWNNYKDNLEQMHIASRTYL